MRVSFRQCGSLRSGHRRIVPSHPDQQRIPSVADRQYLPAAVLEPAEDIIRTEADRLVARVTDREPDMLRAGRVESPLRVHGQLFRRCCAFRSRSIGCFRRVEALDAHERRVAHAAAEVAPGCGVGPQQRDLYTARPFVRPPAGEVVRKRIRRMGRAPTEKAVRQGAQVARCRIGSRAERFNRDKATGEQQRQAFHGGGNHATEQGMPSASTRAAIRSNSSRGTLSSVRHGVSRSME